MAAVALAILAEEPLQLGVEEGEDQIGEQRGVRLGAELGEQQRRCWSQAA